MNGKTQALPQRYVVVLTDQRTLDHVVALAMRRRPKAGARGRQLGMN
jgi:hypothetical protein